jgi:hypothetical protein
MMSKTECSIPGRFSSIDESNYTKSYEMKGCKAEAPCEVEFINSMKANASLPNPSSSPASTSSSASSSINQYQNQICFFTPVTHSQFKPDEFAYKQTENNTLVQSFGPQKIARAQNANKPQIRYSKQTYNLNSNVFTNEPLVQKCTQSPQVPYNASKKAAFLTSSNNLPSASLNPNSLSASYVLIKKENMPNYCPNDGRFEEIKPKCSYPLTNTAHSFKSIDETGSSFDVMSNFMPKNESASNLFDDLPDLEDLMSLVTFEAPSVTSNSFFQTQSDLKLTTPDFISSNYQVCTNLNSALDSSQTCSNVASSFVLEANESERLSRSEPQSPLTPYKKQRIDASVSLHKSW